MLNPYLSIGRQQEGYSNHAKNALGTDSELVVIQEHMHASTSGLRAMGSERESRRLMFHQRLQNLIDLLHQRSTDLMEQRMRLERQATSKIKEAAAQVRLPLEEHMKTLVSWQKSIDSSEEGMNRLHEKMDEFESLCLAGEGSLPSLPQLFGQELHKNPPFLPPLDDVNDQDQMIQEVKKFHREIGQQTGNNENPTQLADRSNDAEMKLLKDAYKQGLAEIQTNHIREIAALKDRHMSQTSRLTSEVLYFKCLLSSEHGSGKNISVNKDKAVQVDVGGERKEPVTKEELAVTIAEILASSESERAAETRLQVYRLQEHYEAKIDLMNQEVAKRQSEIDEMKALLLESHSSITIIRKSQEQQNEIANFRRRLASQPLPTAVSATHLASPTKPSRLATQTSATTIPPVKSPSAIERSSSQGVPDYRDAKKATSTPSKSTPHPRRGLFQPLLDWDQLDAPTTQPAHGDRNCPQESPTCIRCGLNNALSPGVCAFHPALLHDPGPLLFSAPYNLCSSLGHSQHDKACYSRTAHTFPAQIQNTIPKPSESQPSISAFVTSPTRPWIPPPSLTSPAPLPRSSKLLPSASSFRR